MRDLAARGLRVGSDKRQTEYLLKRKIQCEISFFRYPRQAKEYPVVFSWFEFRSKRRCGILQFELRG